MDVGPTNRRTDLPRERRAPTRSERSERREANPTSSVLLHSSRIRRPSARRARHSGASTIEVGAECRNRKGSGRGCPDGSRCRSPASSWKSASGLGEVAEWLKALVSKTGRVARPSWVRIPPSPFLLMRQRDSSLNLRSHDPRREKWWRGTEALPSVERWRHDRTELSSGSGRKIWRLPTSA